MQLPQSTASRRVFKMVLSSDHFSPATGKTVAVTISKNGGAFANPSAGATNATEIGSGWYFVDLSTTDTDTLGPLVVKGTAASCDDGSVADDVILAPGSPGGALRLGSNVGDITLTGNGLGHVALTIDGVEFHDANAGQPPISVIDSIGGNCLYMVTAGSGVPILVDGSAGGHAVFLKSGTGKDIFHATIGTGGVFFNPGIAVSRPVTVLSRTINIDS